MTKSFNAAELTSLLNDARLFDAELARVRTCEAADAETDPSRRTEARRRVVDAGFVWGKPDFTAREVDLLYGMAREACRIALARRSAAFQATYQIIIDCGDAEAQ